MKFSQSYVPGALIRLCFYCLKTKPIRGQIISTSHSSYWGVYITSSTWEAYEYRIYFIKSHVTALWRKLTDQSVECDDGTISRLIYWLCAGILTSRRHSMVSGVHGRYLCGPCVDIYCGCFTAVVGHNCGTDIDGRVVS